MRNTTRPAISFLAFLTANYGPGKLNRYLERIRSQPHRSGGGNRAYHHPLAVLEEEWAGHGLVTNPKLERPFSEHLSNRSSRCSNSYKWKQVEILCYLVLAGAFNVVQPYSIKIVIDRLTKQVRGGPAIYPPGAVYQFVHILVPFLLLLLGLYFVNGIVSVRRNIHNQLAQPECIEHSPGGDVFASAEARTQLLPEG